VKSRFVRAGGHLSDSTIIIVRGGPLRRDLLEADAHRSHAIYGVHAISVFAAEHVSWHELVQITPLVRFDRITLMTVGAVRSAGLVVTPSGRNPLHHSIEFTDLDDGLDRLLSCKHRTISNPYHER
jgi:hypothetical protein